MNNPNPKTTITEDEYEFIKFCNVNHSACVNGIAILRRYGLRDGKRILHSLMKKGVLEWNEEDSKDGVYSPIGWGVNYVFSVQNYIMGRGNR